jgi:hypothetical protein
MAGFSIPWSPAPRQLRQFGLLCLFVLPVAAWVGGFGWPAVMAVGFSASVLALTAWAQPAWIRPIFVTAMLLTMPVGLVVGELAMLTIYFGVLLPIGLCFRLIGRDALKLSMRRQAQTYWEPRSELKRAAGYYRRY